MTDDPGVVDAAHLALNAVHSIVYGSVASLESNWTLDMRVESSFTCCAMMPFISTSLGTLYAAQASMSACGEER